MRPRDLHQTRQIRIPERWIRLFGGEGADPAIELEVDVVFCGWKCFRDWAWKFGGERIVAEAQPS